MDSFDPCGVLAREPHEYWEDYIDRLEKINGGDGEEDEDGYDFDPSDFDDFPECEISIPAIEYTH